MTKPPAFVWPSIPTIIAMATLLYSVTAAYFNLRERLTILELKTTYFHGAEKVPGEQ